MIGPRSSLYGDGFKFDNSTCIIALKHRCSTAANRDKLVHHMIILRDFRDISSQQKLFHPVDESVT